MEQPPNPIKEDVENSAENFQKKHTKWTVWARASLEMLGFHASTTAVATVITYFVSQKLGMEIPLELAVPAIAGGTFPGSAYFFSKRLKKLDK